MFYHVIFFTFSPEVSADDISQIFCDLGKLQKDIPQIASYHFGSNDSSNINNKNFEHCFIMSFANKEDRYIYQNHPTHQAFISHQLKPILNNFIVFDFEDLNTSFAEVKECYQQMQQQCTSP